MENIVKLLKFIQPGIFIYWMLSKFIDVSQNQIYSILYEMSSLLFVLATFIIPVFIIIYWVKNENRLTKKTSFHLLFHLLFSIFNIYIMTLDPAVFK